MFIAFFFSFFRNADATSQGNFLCLNYCVQSRALLQMSHSHPKTETVSGISDRNIPPQKESEQAVMTISKIHRPESQISFMDAAAGISFSFCWSSQDQW